MHTIGNRSIYSCTIIKPVASAECLLMLYSAQEHCGAHCRVASIGTLHLIVQVVHAWRQCRDIDILHTIGNSSLYSGTIIKPVTSGERVGLIGGDFQEITTIGYTPMPGCIPHLDMQLMQCDTQVPHINLQVPPSSIGHARLLLLNIAVKPVAILVVGSLGPGNIVEQDTD